MCEDPTCSNLSHLACIESFYNDIVEALLDAGLEHTEYTSRSSLLSLDGMKCVLKFTLKLEIVSCNRGLLALRSQVLSMIT